MPAVLRAFYLGLWAMKMIQLQFVARLQSFVRSSQKDFRLSNAALQPFIFFQHLLWRRWQPELFEIMKTKQIFSSPTRAIFVNLPTQLCCKNYEYLTTLLLMN